MANVSQLKVLLNTTKMTAQPIALIVLVAISMIMQLLVGMALAYVAYSEQDDSIQPDNTPAAAGLLPPTTEEAANDNFDRMAKVGRLHTSLTNFATMGIFIILFINIVISGLGLSLPAGDDAKFNIDHLGIETTTTTTTVATTT